MDNNHNIISNVDDKEDPFVLAWQITQSGAVPKVLKAVVELKVLDIMSRSGAATGLTAREIAARVEGTRDNEVTGGMLDRMLRMLATHSIVGCTVDGSERRYSLNLVSKLFVPNARLGGVCLSPFLALMEDPILQASWDKLKDAVLEGGIPFNMVYGMHAYDPNLDKRYNDLFNGAMFNLTSLTMNKLLEKYKGFDGVKRLVDVGGGFGHALHAIISKYPSIKGINFDLPHVIHNAISCPGVEHISGDMFEFVPQGDAIFMKYMLHALSDEYCVRTLKNCHKALPPEGKMVVVESIAVGGGPETTPLAKAISQTDVYLMTKTYGGKDRTLEEFQGLAEEAGFTSVKVACHVFQFAVIEFLK